MIKCHWKRHDKRQLTEVAMNIREMEKEDYNRVYALWLSCKGMGLNDVDDSKNGIERF